MLTKHFTSPFCYTRFNTIKELFSPPTKQELDADPYLINEKTHASCEFCSDESDSDVWHPWYEYQTREVNGIEKTLCLSEWVEADKQGDDYFKTEGERD